MTAAEAGLSLFVAASLSGLLQEGSTVAATESIPLVSITVLVGVAAGIDTDTDPPPAGTAFAFAFAFTFSLVGTVCVSVEVEVIIAELSIRRILVKREMSHDPTNASNRRASSHRRMMANACIATVRSFSGMKEKNSLGVPRIIYYCCGIMCG